MTTVAVGTERLERWVENFTGRHGTTVLSVADGALVGRAEDGSVFGARLPFSRTYAGSADVRAFLEAAAVPEDWAVLLVRKGGFAVARLRGPELLDSKVGQRHVQGRTKAGGQSQQRFARRRDNQARAAYEAAADHAARLAADAALAVVGGDQAAVASVLEDVRLRGLQGRVVGSFLAVPDPRRAVLEQACRDAASITVAVENA